MLKTKYFITLMIILSSSAKGQDVNTYNKNKLFSYSLEELLNVKVSTGSLSDVVVKNSPSAITVIRQDQIKVSAAKNLSSLVEQFVPGLIVMEHSEGNKIGIRGLIAAENYKLLLLVNGRNITNMVYEGAILELDQWDINDIEKVEVVRGPGSVTYGTGAIAGVINIITKKAKDAGKITSVNLTNNPTYRSTGGNIQYADKLGDVGFYGFLSYRRTKGFDDPNYFFLGPNETSDIRYLGDRPSDLYGPQDYLADGLDRPQVKAHIDLNFSDNFNVWARYTQSGQTHNYTTKSLNPVTNEQINHRKVDIRGFVTSGEYLYDIDKSSHLKTSLTFDNQEYIRRDFQNNQYPEDHINNVNNYAFSQQRLVGSVLYDYTDNDALKLVTGYEYSNIGVRSPWHQSDDHLWIKEGVNLISSIDSSVYMQDTNLNGRPSADKVEEVGDGFNFATHSHLIEASYQLNESNQILYAHRIDIPDTSGTMFSPRLSVISQINDKNTLVITAQRAERMMQLRAQYLYDKNGSNDDSSDYEKLDGIEVSLTNNSIEKTSFNLRAYYNDIHAIGFTGTDLQFLSDVELLGLDFEAKYKDANTEFIFNHAYLTALNVSMNEDLKDGSNRNNISFADYYYTSRGDIPLLLESYGDGLNNLSSHISKFIITQKYLDDQLIAQLNAQVYWSYDGSYDEMEMYQAAYDNFDISTLSTDDKIKFIQQQAEFDKERELLDQEDAFKMDYDINFSLTYQWQYSETVDMGLTFAIENLTRSKKTYYVSTGSNRHYPERLRFMEKPRSIGLNFEVNFY